MCEPQYERKEMCYVGEEGGFVFISTGEENPRTPSKLIKIGFDQGRPPGSRLETQRKKTGRTKQGKGNSSETG